jgi:hypothetical protein
MEITVYQSIISIFHKSLDLLISSLLKNNNNFCVVKGLQYRDSMIRQRDSFSPGYR